MEKVFSDNFIQGSYDPSVFSSLEKEESEFYLKIAQAKNFKEINGIFETFIPKFENKLKNVFNANPFAVENIINTYILICYYKSSSIRNVEISRFVSQLSPDLQKKFIELNKYFQNSLVS